MLHSSTLCKSVSTTKKKHWKYTEYYFGDKDEEGRKDGLGENHWSGAESLEWYEGSFLRDTMHGAGDYYWRFLGHENAFVTYEGHFYFNQIQGYGTMSYPDGRTFNGLFLNNVRWGPGIESHANLCDDVGLWRGHQLLRLAWRPSAPSITPELGSVNTGQMIIESYRVMLSSETQNFGEMNTAVELLKQHGADTNVAAAKWHKIYSNYSNDVSSALCTKDLWNEVYYKESIEVLREIENTKECKENENGKNKVYYAWNNNKTMIDMMKHTYNHEKQRNSSILDIKSILSGNRNSFKLAGPYEMECRTMLMACYLGYIECVTRLVNENKVNPNICDARGNSAIMYAVCGDQPEIIHFLVDAGANVDLCNDDCCTPLTVALLRYSCTQNDVAPNATVQALLPPPTIPVPPSAEQNVFEWNIIRGQTSTSPAGTLTKTPSKTTRNMSSKKIKSLLSLKDQPQFKTKTDPMRIETPDSDNIPISYEAKMYNKINQEYCTKVAETYNNFNGITSVPYLFHIYDVIKEIDVNDDDPKKTFEKVPKKVTSKLIKEILKPSKDALCNTDEGGTQLLDDSQKRKIDILSKSMLTILQLLSHGAEPTSIRCPQPALFIAITSNSPILIHHLINYGADVNEKYNQLFDYSSLDLVMCRPFSWDNFEMAKILLECGADANHRLDYRQEVKDQTATDVKVPGPTLLHIVLGRKTENENEEDIRRQLLELLLEYNCSATTQFKGRSAIDVAMNKSLELFHVFIKNSKTDLNATINNANQNILMKFFNLQFFRNMASADRLQTITNLLLFGGDPLLKCQEGHNIYENIFVYAKHNLSELDSTQTKLTSPQFGKVDSKGKKTEKPKKEEKLSTKSIGKMSADEVEDYKQAVELMTDCARLVYVRWLQGKLMKELVKIINRFRHRHWNMIIKELSDIKNSIWLTPQRCLEIWDILGTTPNSIYKDKRILRHLLCIVIFMSWRDFGNSNESNRTLTTSLKDAIESDVINMLCHRYRKKSAYELNRSPAQILLVKPELSKDVKKYEVCFECMQPLNQNMIVCCWCKFVSFCSNECLESSINRENSHPCNNYLRAMYVSSQEVINNNSNKFC